MRAFPLAVTAVSCWLWPIAAWSAAADVTKPPLVPNVARSPGQTRCATCHTVGGWEDAAFAHDKTGFPLLGRHRTAGCRNCHLESLNAPIPKACGSCHRDAHAGEFGARCEGCHDTRGWETSFNVDSHRRTNFPLMGAHAVIPCQECHADSRGRTFTRATVDCIGCHQRDYNRAALTTLDHAAAGFSTSCRECHAVWRFSGATFPAHDRCFQIDGPKHAGITCLGCHTTLAGAKVNGTCSTGTAACSACHQHVCSTTDKLHTNVPGYQCKDQKCYQCHRFAP